MFNVCTYMQNGDLDHCCVRDSYDLNRYLHSDGQVFNTPEYWPTKEAAQAVLDKFYPKPKHVWEHGDVFKSVHKFIPDVMMYLHPEKKHGKRGPRVVYMSSDTYAYGPINQYLADTKFLFNIKDIIKEKL